MASKKVVVVFGATGGQGGSVIKSILGDPKASERFSIRAITRDVSKPAAKALANNGCDVVLADMDDYASIVAALRGAYGVYAVTNYWEKVDAGNELKQGKRIADACKEVGVEHLVWSSLMNISKLTEGRLDKVHHFDSKAEVEDYIREIGVPYTAFMPGGYMANFPGQTINKNTETGVYTIALPIPPTTTMPLYDHIEDTGKFVKAILMKPKQTLGKQIYGAQDYYSMERLAKEFEQVKPVDGKGAMAIEVPHDVYKGFLSKAGMPPFVQEELLQNFLLNVDPGYYGGASLEESQAILDEPLTTWKQHLEKSEVIKDLK